MGKGTINNHIGSGQYSVALEYFGRARVTARVAALNSEITALESRIATMPEGINKTIAELQVKALEKERDYITGQMPDDPDVNIWCVDLTEDLTGDVGIIEIPGERTNVLVRPGYNGGAVYNTDRDGQLMPVIAATNAQFLFNLMLLPGWQKFKPLHRIGTIVDGSIDFDADTCSVCIDPTYSSQRNFNVNSADFAECAAAAHSGWTTFCSNNPGHALCTNTNSGAPRSISTTELAQLTSVNQSVNAAHAYQTDASGYNVGDLWAVMGAGDRGDCEDFALTKADELISSYGWSPSDLKIVLGYTETGGYHAVLAVQTTNHGTLILDNRSDAVREMSKVPYAWERFADTGASWKGYTARLESVPIEYMTCNANAFADGDRVIVEFTGQDWSVPKVIGFYSNPVSCSANEFYILFGHTDGYITLGYRYTIDVNVFASIPFDEGLPIRSGPVSAVLNNKVYCSGGFAGWSPGGGWDDYQPLNPNWELLKRCTEFDPFDNSYTEKTEMIKARSLAAGFRAGNEAYCAGGCDYVHPDYLFLEFGDPPKEVIKNYYDENESYNATTNAWTSKTSLTADRFNAASMTIAGLGYVMAGYSSWYIGLYNNQYGVQTDTNYSYDSLSNGWTTRQELSTVRAELTGAAIGTIGYLFGGYSETSLTVDDSCNPDPAIDFCGTHSAVQYNSVSTAWSSNQKLPTSVLGEPSGPCRDHACAADGSKVFITMPAPGVISYNPVTDSYSELIAVTDANYPGSSYGIPTRAAGEII